MGKPMGINIRKPLPKQTEQSFKDKSKYDRTEKKHELMKLIKDVSKEIRTAEEEELYKYIVIAEDKKEREFFSSVVNLASKRMKKKQFSETEYQTGGFDIMKQVMKHPNPVKKEASLTHNSKVNDKEPAWSDVDKTALPRNAFANEGEEGVKSSWKYPHHYVVGGTKNKDGVYESGDMYLHKGGLNAAWGAAQGARSGQEAGPAVKAHLQSHRKALGLN